MAWPGCTERGSLRGRKRGNQESMRGVWRAGTVLTVMAALPEAASAGMSTASK
jgi:hypothetical protein